MLCFVMVGMRYPQLSGSQREELSDAGRVAKEGRLAGKVVEFPRVERADKLHDKCGVYAGFLSGVRLLESAFTQFHCVVCDEPYEGL